MYRLIKSTAINNTLVRSLIFIISVFFRKYLVIGRNMRLTLPVLPAVVSAIAVFVESANRRRPVQRA
jgi:hypothetical protein